MLLVDSVVARRRTSFGVWSVNAQISCLATSQYTAWALGTLLSVSGANFSLEDVPVATKLLT